MLVLSRKPGECVVIDGRIKVKIVRLDGDVVKLGIEAPPDIPIHRQEVYDEIQLSNKQALQTKRPAAPKLKDSKTSDLSNHSLSDRQTVETAGLAA
jgi:carbon storage regulator